VYRGAGHVTPLARSLSHGPVATPPMPKQLIVIDGDVGGGQILRNGFALAALALQPLRIINIRAAKKPPGLTGRQLQAIQMVSQLCGGKLRGGREESMQVSFTPGHLMDGEMIVDTGSTSSLTLLAQIILPCLLFTPGPCTWEAKGATDLNFAPPFDELWAVFLPTLARFGVSAQLELKKRGFGVKGGGRLALGVDPPAYKRGLTPLILVDQGKVVRVDGRAFVTEPEEEQFMTNLVESVKSILADALPGVLVQIQPVTETEETAVGRGRGITLVAITDTGCRFGSSALCDHLMKAPGDYADEVVKKLARQVKNGACVDEWTQDQIVIFMALAAGRSEVRVGDITEHTRSAIMAAETILPCRFEIFNKGKTNILACDGVGLLTPGTYSTALVDRPRATSLNAPHLVPFVPNGEQPPPEPEEAESSEDEEPVYEEEILGQRTLSSDDEPDPNAPTFVNPFTGGVMTGPRSKSGATRTQPGAADPSLPFGPKKSAPFPSQAPGSGQSDGGSHPFGPRSTPSRGAPSSSAQHQESPHRRDNSSYFAAIPTSPVAPPSPSGNPFGSAAAPTSSWQQPPPVQMAPPVHQGTMFGGGAANPFDAGSMGSPAHHDNPFGATWAPPQSDSRYPLDRAEPGDAFESRKRGREFDGDDEAPRRGLRADSRAPTHALAAPVDFSYGQPPQQQQQQQQWGQAFPTSTPSSFGNGGFGGGGPPNPFS